MRMYFTILLIFCVSGLYSQQYKIGVRAGVNYTKFSGPLETAINEEFKLSGGFHFGFNFTYFVVKDVGIRLELLYTQNGTKNNMSGESYALIKIPGTSITFKEEGTRNQNLEISNAYISLPLSIQVQLNKKFELFGGFYTNFLIGPTAGGKMEFNSKMNPEDEDGIFYTQSLLYDYNSDFLGRSKDAIIDPIVTLDGTDVTIPGAIGAYYFEDGEGEPDEIFINKLDLGFFGGLNYYVNRGLYLGGRVTYGIRDITNSRFDYSLEKLDDNNEFIQRNDMDRLIGFEISMGFRF